MRFFRPACVADTLAWVYSDLQSAFQPAAAGAVRLPTESWFDLDEAAALHASLATLGYDEKDSLAFDHLHAFPRTLAAGDRERTPNHQQRLGVSGALIDELRTLTTSYSALLGGVLAGSDGALALDFAELRRATAATAPMLSDLHQDGGYLAVMVALYGPGTRYLDGRLEHAVPTGQTLVLSGAERAERFPGLNATWHAAPKMAAPRLFYLARFKRRA